MFNVTGCRSCDITERFCAEHAAESGTCDWCERPATTSRTRSDYSGPVEILCDVDAASWDIMDERADDDDSPINDTRRHVYGHEGLRVPDRWSCDYCRDGIAVAGFVVNAECCGVPMDRACQPWCVNSISFK